MAELVASGAPGGTYFESFLGALELLEQRLDQHLFLIQTTASWFTAFAGMAVMFGSFRPQTF